MTNLTKLGSRGGLLLTAAVIAVGLPLVTLGATPVGAATDHRGTHQEGLRNGQCRCESITASAKSGNAPLKVSFRVKPFFGHDMPADQLKNVSVLWDFGDGQTARTDGKFTIEHTYTKPGNYTAKARLAVANGTEVQKPAPCTVNIQVKTPGQPGNPQEPITPVVTPKGTPAELPNTGAAENAAAGLGATGLGIGVRTYLRSRKNLLSSLLNK